MEVSSSFPSKDGKKEISAKCLHLPCLLPRVKIKFLGCFSNFYIHRFISDPLIKRIREKIN